MTLPHPDSNVPDMFERYTDRARRILVLAQEECRDQNATHIGTWHLVAGMAKEGECIAAKVLTEDLGLSYQMIKEAIPIPEKPGEPERLGEPGAPPFSVRLKKILEYGLREALQLGHNYIAPEHLLLAVFREGESSFVKWAYTRCDVGYLPGSPLDQTSWGPPPVRAMMKRRIDQVTSSEKPRRILFSSEAPGREKGHGWQYLDENPWHPFLEPEARQIILDRIAALRSLLEPVGAELETTRGDGWKFSFKLESA